MQVKKKQTKKTKYLRLDFFHIFIILSFNSTEQNKNISKKKNKRQTLGYLLCTTSSLVFSKYVR